MRNILITGASTGIGKSFVQQASGQLTDTRIIVLTRHTLEYPTPNTVEVHLVDLTDHKKVARIIKGIIKKHGAIDTLINNAGNGWRGMIEDTTIEEAKAQLETNVWALVNVTNLVLPSMRAMRHGHIVNLTSVAASISYGTIGYYSATKAFIDKISDVMAIELEPWNIKVSLVAPGAVRTKFGHNMINIKKYNTGDYKPFYKEWADRFEIMFQTPLSSDEAAKRLLWIIDHPKRYTYLTKRDAFYCYIKRIIPRRIFNGMFLRRYMNI